jgi:hypothetical protein
VRSFRFQWPADLLTSWATEMELIVLGWYVLTATGSVLLLTLYGALQYAGTLLGPFFGLAGDRLGHRNVLCGMRLVYAALAATMAGLALTDTLTPLAAMLVAAVSGLVRPSDFAMRNALVAETMPGERLMAAMGVARTTSDSARVVGALAGAAVVATLGMGPAYAGVTAFHALSCVLTLGCGAPRAAIRSASLSIYRDLREGLVYVADSPAALAAMCIAFLTNMTAYPLTLGLMPYVARDVYHVGQAELGTLVASFALGSLIGSIGISFAGTAIRPARLMLIGAHAWYVLLLGFVLAPAIEPACAMLVLAGIAQSCCMVPMSVMLLTGAGVRFRGRVMGVRMLAIYGLPVGLMLAGWLIPLTGYVATACAYCLGGLGLTALIALRWRRALWPMGAVANALPGRPPQNP